MCTEPGQFWWIIDNNNNTDSKSMERFLVCTQGRRVDAQVGHVCGGENTNAQPLPSDYLINAFDRECNKQGRKGHSGMGRQDFKKSN